VPGKTHLLALVFVTIQMFDGAAPAQVCIDNPAPLALPSAQITG